VVVVEIVVCKSAVIEPAVTEESAVTKASPKSLPHTSP
jgi:hypothetical protein